MNAVVNVITHINEIYWYFVIALLVGAGVYFCIRTSIVQIRSFPEMLRVIGEKPGVREDGQQGISAFRAFCISAAARVGTGNVAGVAVAITVGGPGAVFWMWLLAIIGGATAFVESTLGQLYKVDDNGVYRGGPAYYIRLGLGWKKVSALFAVVITLTYGFIFNAVQSNSISVTMAQTFGSETGSSSWVNYVCGTLIALATAAVIFGGVRRISLVSSIIVPVMAIAYIAVALLVVLTNLTEVPAMITLIFEHAFGIKEITGAGVGAAMMNGMRRGLFSNEAGMGSVPNAAATASVSHPVKQGLVQSLGVYFDTLVVCSMTAFVILLSHPTFGGDVEGSTLTQSSIASQVGSWAMPFCAIVILFLAFSSIMGNYYYGQSNVEFLGSKRSVVMWYRLAVLVFVFGGAIASVPLVWQLADLFMGVMATINLIAIIPLGGLAFALLKNYLSQRLQGLNPVFSRQDLPQAKNVPCWDGSDPLTVRQEEANGSWGDSSPTKLATE